MAPRDASAAAAASTPATRPSHDSSDPHEFEWSYTEEPHMSRRMKVLAAHPEVRGRGGHPDLCRLSPSSPTCAPGKRRAAQAAGAPLRPQPRVQCCHGAAPERGGAGEAWHALGAEAAVNAFVRPQNSPLPPHPTDLFPHSPPSPPPPPTPSPPPPSQVRELYGADPMLKWKVLGAVATQVFMCYVVSDLSWPLTLLLAYCIGGLINHSMTLGMHEISHNLAFKNMPNANRIFGMIANLPLAIPSSVSFRRYHMEHHMYQGEDGIDADIPTAMEGKIFTNTFTKTLWMLLQPLFYALRPVIVLPKAPTAWEGANWAVQVSFNYAIYHFFGSHAVVYLLLGTILGMGIHPMAGHFVAEHYTFLKGQETYSYYGPLNWLSFNVGYHNEHHDFPFIAGSRLPKLREIAPEFYDDLPHHTSWVMVIWRYIVDPAIGPWSRIKRSTLDDAKFASIREQGKGANEKCT
jgi:sphingolipid 4-desaturase/C4-monooxygenase